MPLLNNVMTMINVIYSCVTVSKVHSSVEELDLITLERSVFKS